MSYRFKENHVVVLPNWDKADPDEIGNTLEKIRLRNNGDLVPADVVNEARKTSSPIHKHFEWDNNRAANSYRISQARKLIGCIEIVDITCDKLKDGAPAFLSVNLGEGPKYKSVRDVVDNKVMQREIFRQAERDLRGFITRYRQLKEICADIETVVTSHFEK